MRLRPLLPALTVPRGGYDITAMARAVALGARPGRLAHALLCAGVVASSVTGCSQAHTPSNKGAAPPARIVTEGGLATVQLNAEAATRLDIPNHLATVERRRHPRMQLYGGEVIAVPGHVALVTAPVAATVLPPPDSAFPVAGMAVASGQGLATLAPLLLPLDRLQVAAALADSQGQLARAQVQYDAAELALQRAQRLVSEQAAGAKQLEEAQAQRDTAQAALAQARAHASGISGNAGRPGVLSALRIEAPIAGTLRDVRVTIRQQVAAGTPLFEVVADDPLWVRVPVLVADHAAIAATAPALVGSSAAQPAKDFLLAPPVKSPPLTAQPLAGTIDRYYALTNAQHRFRPGARVVVLLPLQGDEPVPVVPWSAVVLDVYGNPWVYQQTAAQTFVRRRIEIAWVDGDIAVLTARSLDGADGLRLGAKVVTAGAVELWGTELGVGK